MSLSLNAFKLPDGRTMDLYITIQTEETEWQGRYTLSEDEGNIIADPIRAWHIMGQEALLDVLTQFVELGFIVGSKKGQPFAEQV